MKKTLILATVMGAVSMPVYAVEATNNTTTNTSTDVSTDQNSGVTLSGKAKVLPHASITTGDNTATTDVRTSVDNTSTARASNSTRTNVDNRSYHNTKGKGHKYGHDKHD